MTLATLFPASYDKIKEEKKKGKKKISKFFHTTLQYRKKCSVDFHIFGGNEVWPKERIEHNSSIK